ncbi:plasmid transfer protein TraB [Streptomyces erythrochromogenes]|uniref:plasmid transfer protein TraB n=1 Tax=Streptomyces erythrochromogenes TaxID=285574 RepID=UPI00386938E7|nr:sporulation protein SsgA [Streptomyces erythrochromogenes]
MAGKDVEQRHEDQLKGSSDSGGIKGYLLHRAKPYLPPWLGVGAVGAASTIGHLVWSGDVGMGIGLTLGSVALTGSTWWAAKSTGRERRLHSAITVAAASAWTTHAVAFGPAPVPFVVGGTVVALSWNIRQVMRRDPDGAKTTSSDGGLLEKVGLAKARMRDAKVEPNRVTVPLEVEGGEQTNDDVTRALPRIASALDLPTTAIRYSPDPDSARRGDLVIVPMDMLSEIVLWEGPALPGGSIADPLVIGRYDNGDPLQLWLPADVEESRNGTHLLIAGGTGSGKGDGALNVLTEILSRKDVVVWLSDPKAFQDFRPLLPGIDWAVEAGAGTEAMVEAVQAVIPARTRWLGVHKYRAWEPSCAERQDDPAHSCRTDGTACGCEGMPFLVTWFEEAANTLRALGDDAFTGIAQEARSAGVSLVVSLQRPSHDQMSTSTRASLPSVLCFGVDKRDEGFALPDTVLDAGAHPGVWGNRRPGYCYLVTPGVDETLYPSPARTRRFTWDSVSLMETLAAWAARNGAKPDPITADAAASVVGKAYTERAQHKEENPDEGERTVSRLDDEDRDIDPNEELPDPLPGEENVIFGQPEGRDLSADEARTVLEEILTEYENEGTMVIGPVDVMKHGERLGRKRGWVSGELQRLLAEGRLAETAKPGRYRIVPQLVDA